jgi:Uma2 family endonuclease
VRSSRLRTREVKLPRYAAVEIPEGWIVDIDADVLHVYRDPSPDRYRTSLRFQRGEVVAPAAFPDVMLAVDAILG